MPCAERGGLSTAAVREKPSEMPNPSLNPHPSSMPSPPHVVPEGLLDPEREQGVTRQDGGKAMCHPPRTVRGP